ncbi:hypothetical protein GCM10010106_02980 [Thermopolyspora flexuosa]|nr:hypothetical protein GCM10010106_02980 [Thermopolyspora flexuosa]
MTGPRCEAREAGTRVHGRVAPARLVWVPPIRVPFVSHAVVQMPPVVPPVVSPPGGVPR